MRRLVPFVHPAASQLLCLGMCVWLAVLSGVRLRAGEAQAPAAPPAARPAVLVTPTGPGTYAVGKVAFDKVRRTIAIQASLISPSSSMRDQILEYALVTPRGKVYEALFTTEADPKDIHLAALLLGLSPAPLSAAIGEVTPMPEGSSVGIEVSWQSDGTEVIRPLNELVVLGERTPTPVTPRLPTGPWLYSGSQLQEGGAFLAQATGSIVSLISDPDALVNNPHPDRANHDIHFANTPLLPPVDAAVTITFKLPRARTTLPATAGQIDGAFSSTSASKPAATPHDPQPAVVPSNGVRREKQ